jgi:hypothetical protein
MEDEKREWEQITYNDAIPDPEEEAPPRDDEADAPAQSSQAEPGAGRGRAQRLYQPAHAVKDN